MQHNFYMGWEKRGNKFYYYEKVRVDNKIKSVYFGNGELAQLISDASTLLKRHKTKIKSVNTKSKQDLVELKKLKKLLRKYPTYKEKIELMIEITKLIGNPKNINLLSS